MRHLFTSESVSAGHPDKVSDQISDALLDQFLAYDGKAHCAIETFVTTGQVVIMGEVRSNTYIDFQNVAREMINKAGYTKAEYQFDGNSCGILTAIHEQSDDINRGISNKDTDEQGAGDQGMMFGYATNETENYMPVSLDLAHLIMRTLSDIRREGKEMTYLRPDAKSQVTIEYTEDKKPLRIDTIVVSTQHDNFDKDDKKMLDKIKSDVINILMPRVISQCGSKIQKLFNSNIKYLVNPTGEIRYRRSAWGYRAYWTQNNCGYIRRARSARWRCFLWKGSKQGRSQCCLYGTIYCQKYGSSRGCGRNSCAAGLCHRCGCSCQRIG